MVKLPCGVKICKIATISHISLIQIDGNKVIYLLLAGSNKLWVTYFSTDWNKGIATRLFSTFGTPQVKQINMFTVFILLYRSFSIESSRRYLSNCSAKLRKWMGDR